MHISQALAPIGRLLGYDVTIVDPRTAFASQERFPDVTVIAERPDTALPPLGIDRYTAFVALTHDPKIDDPALTHALARECFYIGALGSRKTHARRLARLKEQGVTDNNLEVLSGLATNETLVIEGASSLDDGYHLTILPDGNVVPPETQ